ncbi:flagellar hook-associated protein FlgK [Oxalobacter sp. OttesenSCG-928-P03]|nr:flagellar hook-associated protein FlgK [Oxalobacter sp. OttesenSCG-928-P03]
MGNIYSIGKSALLGANYAISVTGHNISNASTPGYNRQVILQSNIHGQQFGFGFVGNGMQLDDIRRVYDEFLGKQVNDTQSEFNRLDTYYNQISKINNKLADDTAGVSPALQDFFSAVQEIASTPTSAATREAMLSEAEMLVGRYNNLASQMNEQRDLANAQIIHSVELINSYATEIAKLNDQIARAQIAITDPAPNDLLDQRDYLISQLSQEIGVRTVVNGNSLDVYIGNGQPLVINNNSFPMFAQYSQSDPETVEIGYINNGVKVVIPDKLLSGGNIMGYKEFLSNEVDPILNELGRIAITLATDFNNQHKLGMDLNGDPGGDFFSFVATSSMQNYNRTGTVTADVVDTKALYASNYQIAYNDSPSDRYTIIRQSDGQTVWDGATMPTTPIDGIQFSLTGTLESGDTLTLKPLNDVAESLQLLISDPNKIAAALSIRTAHDANNLGTGKISLGELVDLNDPGNVSVPNPSNLELEAMMDTSGSDPVLRFVVKNVAVTATYSDGSSHTYNPGDAFAYEEGMSLAMGDFTFNITGTVEPGDKFYIQPNDGGTGDNRNMLALAALQDSKTMLNGTTTYQGAYSQLVNRVGSKTRELEITSTSTGNLLNSLYEEQQSQSGVNLDEEAINLMRYQQNYNAASKVIQTANEMFDAILAIF